MSVYVSILCVLLRLPNKVAIFFRLGLPARSHLERQKHQLSTAIEEGWVVNPKHWRYPTCVLDAMPHFDDDLSGSFIEKHAKRTKSQTRNPVATYIPNKQFQPLHRPLKHVFHARRCLYIWVISYSVMHDVCFWCVLASTNLNANGKNLMHETKSSSYYSLPYGSTLFRIY